MLSEVTTKHSLPFTVYCDLEQQLGRDNLKKKETNEVPLAIKEEKREGIVKKKLQTGVLSVVVGGK